MTPDEIAMQAPATLADRFHLAFNTQVTRITFQEQTSGQTVNRAAIAISTANLIELRNALSDVISRIEGKAQTNDNVVDVPATEVPDEAA